jgi:Fe-S-cluster-containing dehydrogenase component
MKIWMDPKKCKGCLRCELACSFHKSGHKLFNPALSSTRVLRDNDNKEITMIIDESCDFCQNEDEDLSLCVKYCVFGARGVMK